MPRTGLDIVNEINRELNHQQFAASKTARIVVTSTGENPPPWFLVIDTGNIRDQFIDDTVQMLFGRQADNELHTWTCYRALTLGKDGAQ